MFTRQSEEEYREACAPDAWEPVRQAFAGDRGNAVSADALEPLAWPLRRVLQNEVLVAGMPLAALPVESLYRPWSQAPRNNYGAQRGMYLGDAAQHMQALYDALGIEVPEAFAAMPDHLTLELDLLALLLESGNEKAARELVADHFGWLGDYDKALAARSEEAERAQALDDGKKAALCKGVAQLRVLVVLVERLATGIANGAPEGSHASTCDREPVAGAGEGERACGLATCADGSPAPTCATASACNPEDASPYAAMIR